MKSLSRKERSDDQIRPIQIVRDFCPESDGSVLFQMGGTRVICAASVSTNVPDHAKLRGIGWITAEYTMLPYSTNPRTERRIGRQDGRAVEIQRLIGRSLRSVVDLSRMSDYCIAIDCDVLQADGGTRTASINGGFIALRLAIEKLLHDGSLAQNPIRSEVAAISAGYVNGILLLDLDYLEDSTASVDMNVVMDGEFNLVEIQGTGEQHPFTREQMDRMLFLAQKGITEIISTQNSVFEK